MADTEIDLHGHKRQPYPGFDEETMYLERVTVLDRAEAARIIAYECGHFDTDEVDPQPIFMRYIHANDEPSNEWAGEFDSWWQECEEGAVGAVPFWRDP